MNQALLIRTVWSQLVRYRAKSFFMMLGIIISVTAIVLVQTTGANIKVKFYDYIHQAYPSNTVFLAAGNGFMGGGKGSDNLKLTDIDALISNVDGISDWDPIVYAGTKNISSFGHNAFISVVGLSELAERAKNRSVSDGRFISEEDVRQKAKVVLIGSKSAQTLFPDGNAIGQSLFYNNVTFEVIGILQEIGADPHGNDGDNVVQMPYTTLMSKILKRNTISGVTFILEQSDADSVDTFIAKVTDILRERHLIAEGDGSDFSLISPTFMLGMVDGVFNNFDIFVPVLSFIVFLISGVVILNIMLVTIKERVGEIGLRKALGARPQDLRHQILAEMLVLCLIGSIIGVVLANVILLLLQPLFITHLGIEQIQTSVAANVIGVVLAIISGLAGALLPAQRAANMNPVTALA